MDKIKKLVVLGGTFNPPHKGHIKLAKSALKSLDADKIIFIPSGNPPHKSGDFLIDKLHRLNMVHLITEKKKSFMVSDIEIKSDEISYSANTLLRLNNIYNPDELYFVIGFDSFFDLEKWYKPELIFERCIIAVAYRKGYNEKDFIEKKLYYENKFNARIVRISMPSVNISSSCIRDKIANNKYVRNMLTRNVYKYISEKNLYKESKC